MSVKIRLTRTGARNAAAFRVVAADSRSPRDGRFLEILGWYDPKLQGRNCSVKLDRIDHWKGQGAIISDTVRSLVKQQAEEAVAEDISADEPVEAATADVPVDEAVEAVVEDTAEATEKDVVEAEVKIAADA